MRAMGAVRTSRRDKWDRSEAVQRYYAWRDALRAYLGLTLSTRWADCREVHVVAHFGTNIHSTWGLPYLETPDADNIYKAVTDACFAEDRGIWRQSCAKLWAQHDHMDLQFIGLLR